MKDLDVLADNGVKRSIGALTPAQDELTNLGLDERILRRYLKSFGIIRERSQFGFESLEPPSGGVRSPLSRPQISISVSVSRIGVILVIF